MEKGMLINKSEYVQRKKVWNLLKNLKEPIQSLLKVVAEGETSGCIEILEASQSIAIAIGTQVESFLGFETQTVQGLEEYCECLYQLSLCLDNRGKAVEYLHKMVTLLEQIELLMKEELELNRIVLLYQVDFKEVVNDDDLLEMKINQIYSMLDKHPRILAIWYVDMTTVFARGLMRSSYKERCKRLFKDWEKHKNCIIDLSKDENAAFAVADAYYGSYNNLYQKFVEAGKPVLMQDIHCVPGHDGYFASECIKEVQKVEMELLHELDRVCRKHGIKYFAYAGTLMGAVRHHGMIPWDDDIDVMMFREDFEKLRAVAEQEFTGRYFLQSSTTEKSFLFPGANLRNKETTAILFEASKQDLNLGIFLDIFIIDSIPDSDAKFQQECEMLQFYYRVFVCRMLYLICPESIEEEEDEKVRKLAQREDFENVLLECDRKREEFDDKDSLLLTIYSEFIMKGFAFWMQRRWFDETIWMPFGDMKIPIPGGYKEILRYMYKDYMIKIRASSTHGDTFFDVEKNYEFYLEGVCEGGN